MIGERYDSDAGLQYLNARYYDPKLAMFIQPDWWEVLQPGVGTNRFAYCHGDPVNCSDPTGHQDAGSVNSKDEDDKLTDTCAAAGGCYSKLSYGEQMGNVCKAGGCAIIAATGLATGVTEVAALVAVVRAPMIYMTAMKIGAAEATGMVAAGGVATKAVATVVDTLENVPAGSLASRVDAVHSVLDKVARNRRTTAGLDTFEGTRLIASGARDLSPVQRAALLAEEVAAKMPSSHAEMTLLENARALGLSPTHMVVNRPFCATYASAIAETGGILNSPTTAYWPK